MSASGTSRRPRTNWHMHSRRRRSRFDKRQMGYRYYSVSLPLHETDEEVTVRPRLDAVADARVRHALAAMHDQHLAIDELIDRLLPLLQLVERNPAMLQEGGG